MLVTNGNITRCIADHQLPYYQSRGYAEVKVKAETPAKPKTAKKGKE